MGSPLETALVGLLVVLRDRLAGTEVLRNADQPERLPASGLVVLRDGERVEGVDVLSPHRVLVEHGAAVECFAADEAARDALAEAVRAAVAADRSLGGAAEDARVTARYSIRADGRALVPAHLFEVKAPRESRSPWDLYRLLSTTPGEQVFRPSDQGGCVLVRS